MRKKQEKVKIFHPEVGESKVLPESVPVWLANGWYLEKSSAPTQLEFNHVEPVEEQE